MNYIQIILFVLAVLNLIPIALAIYYKKMNLALGLAFLETIFVGITGIV